MLNASHGEDSAKDHTWASRKLYAMRQQGYISEKNGLTDLGHQILDKEKLWSLSIPTPKKYDGLWHILVFDIPKAKAGTRISFIRHLQNLGMRFYQRSVWIYPYPCENEVRQIGREYGLLPFLSFIVAKEIDGATALRKQFKLEK